MRAMKIMSAIVLALVGAAAAAQDGTMEREPAAPSTMQAEQPGSSATAASSDRDPAGDEDSVPNDGTLSSEEGEEIVRDEREGEEGDDDFTPSTRISEDLSVSFPTDI